MSALLHKALLAELAEVYRDADALFGGWSCEQSTECCRFGLTGREPYVTAIELLMVEAASARSGRRLASPPKEASRSRRLPLAPVRDEGRCPFLDVDGRCSVYESRPLGCRTFYCGRATPAGKVPHARVVELVRRVQSISIRLGKLGPASGDGSSGDVGRPLRSALVKPARRRPRR